MSETPHPCGYLEHSHTPCGKDAYAFYTLDSEHGMCLWLCERHAGIMAGIWAMMHGEGRDDDGRESGVKR